MSTWCLCCVRAGLPLSLDKKVSSLSQGMHKYERCKPAREGVKDRGELGCTPSEGKHVEVAF